MIEEREFGCASFDGQMLRHKGFKTQEGLAFFLRDSVPKDAYVSCAYYQDPEVGMDKKGWLGADLVFDIDADHIQSRCDKIHDYWCCGKCGFTGKGVTPDKCPACGGEKLETNTWPCELCINSAREEATKLLDLLINDLGVSSSDIRVFFSGHRGYHVYVENDDVKTLDSTARKEIVDYVCGLGLDLLPRKYGGKNSSKPNAFEDVRLSALGWRGRIARCMRDFILTAKEETYESAGLSKNVATTLANNKDKILKRWNDAGPWNAVKHIGPKTWDRLAEFCIGSRSAAVDTVVTTDIHRLIRLPNTLHGKTGFKKVEFPVSDMDHFDPFTGAIAFKKGATTVYVEDAPQFRIGDEVFGPYKNEKVELPTAAALLLVCKNRAEVTE